MTAQLTPLERLRQNYASAFLRYLARREEASLHAGYELGRAAIESQLSVLQLAQIHHDVLLGALQDNTDHDVTAVATAASEFFLEVLATFDMTSRGLLQNLADNR
jgi:Phosphoserine phosphatase RsbU, N-terminal domain